MHLGASSIHPSQRSVTFLAKRCTRQLECFRRQLVFGPIPLAQLAAGSFPTHIVGRTDQSFEHAKIAFVDEVLRPSITEDGHDATADHLDSDRLVEWHVVKRFEDLRQRCAAVRAWALCHQDAFPAKVEDRSVVLQSLDRVRQLPRGDRRIGTVADGGYNGADLLPGRERSNAVVRNDDVDVRVEMR